MSVPLTLVSYLIATHLGIPGWKGYRFTWLDDSDLLQVEGCIPAGVYSRGPRKGQPRYRHPDAVGTRCTITWSRAELDRHADAWEHATGKCRTCVGSEQLHWRRVDDRKEYRPCPRCGGTGEATTRKDDPCCTQPNP